jgi:hypothetical protein
LMSSAQSREGEKEGTKGNNRVKSHRYIVIS